jgi:hypothetical protein
MEAAGESSFRLDRRDCVMQYEGAESLVPGNSIVPCIVYFH